MTGIKVFLQCLLLAFIVTLVVANSVPSDTAGNKDVNGQPKFLDGILQDLESVVQDGATIIKEEQKVVQNMGAGSFHTVTTTVTKSGSSYGGFPRFKRGVILEKVKDFVESVDDKAGHVKDKLAGIVADGYNMGSEIVHKVKKTF